jgi:hypothetical protein
MPLRSKWTQHVINTRARIPDAIVARHGFICRLALPIFGKWIRHGAHIAVDFGKVPALWMYEQAECVDDRLRRRGFGCVLADGIGGSER